MTQPLLASDARLDASGWRWWAALCRGAQEAMIAKAREWPEHGEALMAISRDWNALAAEHMARAMAMEGKADGNYT